METIQQHNRPPQEYIDAYNKVRENIFNYLELKEIVTTPSKVFVFIIPEISLSIEIRFENLQLNYVISKLNKEYPNFKEWFKGKVNSIYQVQNNIDYIY